MGSSNRRMLSENERNIIVRNIKSCAQMDIDFEYNVRNVIGSQDFSDKKCWQRLEELVSYDCDNDYCTKADGILSRPIIDTLVKRLRNVASRSDNVIVDYKMMYAILCETFNVTMTDNPKNLLMKIADVIDTCCA